MSLENALEIYKSLKADMKNMITVDAKTAYNNGDLAAARAILTNTIALYKAKIEEAKGEFSGDNAEINTLITLVNDHNARAVDGIKKIDAKIAEKQQQKAETDLKREAEAKALAEAEEKARAEAEENERAKRQADELRAAAAEPQLADASNPSAEGALALAAEQEAFDELFQHTELEHTAAEPLTDQQRQEPLAAGTETEAAQQRLADEQADDNAAENNSDLSSDVDSNNGNRSED